MKVSVIIPTHNSSQFINETLASVCDQTYRNLEIIVVDANSSDNTVDIVKHRDDNRIKLLEIKEPSLAGATRNRGLEIATGDFINYLDGDDLMAPNKIEEQLKIIRNNQNNIATCSWKFIYPNNKTVAPDSKLLRTMNSDDFISIGWGKADMMPIMAYLIPKRIIDQAGKWDEELKMNEDAEYFLRVLQQTKKVVFTDLTEVFYLKHSNFSVSQPNNEKIGHWLDAIKKIEINLLNSEKHDSQEIIANLYQNLVFQVYPIYKEHIKHAESKIQAHGGSTIKYKRDGKFGWIYSLVGWKLGKRIELLIKD